MLIIDATVPARNLPIRRVLAKLLQSYIYTVLKDKRDKKPRVGDEL